MSTSMFLLVLLFTLFQYTAPATDSQCVYVYGEWSDCMDSLQTRTVDCLCDGNIMDVSECSGTPMLPIEQDCEMEYENCKWKWSRWTVCSAECGGGNTTRTPQCYCDGIPSPVTEEHCEAQLYFGKETVPCNQFNCGEVPALNKLYWMSKDENANWPIENKVFNCSLGRDDEDSPYGQTYAQVLSDPYPSDHKHYEWYYLAKEWIAAQLNMANGVEFSNEALQVITTVAGLLENCAGFTEDQIPQIYALKEKLGRLNNNIGGLSNVDAQVAMMLGANNEETENSRSSRLTFILAIAVPVAAVMVIALALGLTVYYVRDKTRSKVEFESEDEESPNEVERATEVPPPGEIIDLEEKKDSEGEEQQLIDGEL